MRASASPCDRALLTYALLGTSGQAARLERDVTAHGSSAKLIRQLIAGSQVSRSNGERSARPSDAQSASVEAAGDCGPAAPRTTRPTRRDFPQFSRWLLSPRSRCLQFATLSARGLKALVMWFWLEAATTSPAGDSAAVARCCVYRGWKYTQEAL